MISLAEAWFLAMREFGLDPNPSSPLPHGYLGEAARAERNLRDILKHGDIPFTYGADGCRHSVPATAKRRGYRLSFCDSAMVPTGSVPDLPVLEDVRVCEETLSRRIAGMHTPAVPRVRQTKRARRPGRPVGTGYAKKDSALVDKITEVLEGGAAKSFAEAARKVIGRDGEGAPGSGSPESKIKRLNARYVLRNNSE